MASSDPLEDLPLATLRMIVLDGGATLPELGLIGDERGYAVAFTTGSGTDAVVRLARAGCH